MFDLGRHGFRPVTQSHCVLLHFQVQLICVAEWLLGYFDAIIKLIAFYIVDLACISLSLTFRFN